MGTGYRITRSVFLGTIAIITMALQLSIIEFGIYFGILLLMGAVSTIIYLFIHFSEHIDQKVLIELAMDIFAGLIVFTYPEPDSRFFMLDFSFWIATMGMINLATGLFDKSKKDYLWLFILSGIVFIVFGFTVVNYNEEHLASVPILIGIILLIYSLLNFYLARKNIILK
jgi:uncharacterized membrane protein HdeD (DUF308 family)